MGPVLGFNKFDEAVTNAIRGMLLGKEQLVFGDDMGAPKYRPGDPAGLDGILE